MMKQDIDVETLILSIVAVKIRLMVCVYLWHLHKGRTKTSIWAYTSAVGVCASLHASK